MRTGIVYRIRFTERSHFNASPICGSVTNGYQLNEGLSCLFFSLHVWKDTEKYDESESKIVFWHLLWGVLVICLIKTSHCLSAFSASPCLTKSSKRMRATNTLRHAKPKSWEVPHSRASDRVPWPCGSNVKDTISSSSFPVSDLIQAVKRSETDITNYLETQRCSLSVWGENTWWKDKRHSEISGMSFSIIYCYIL